MKITITLNATNTGYTAKSDSCPIIHTVPYNVYHAADAASKGACDLSTRSGWMDGYYCCAQGATPADAEAALHAILAPHIAAMDAHNAALDARNAELAAYLATQRAAEITATLATMHAAGELYTNGSGGLKKLAL